MVTVLQELLLKAKSSETAKDGFIAVVSHELRNPLNSLLCGVELIQAENNGCRQCGSQQNASHFIQGIKNNCEILFNLINSIIDITKLRLGSLDLNVTECDIRSLLGNVLDIYQPIALFKGLSIEMIVARNLPKRIFTDPVRLSQVLKNLLFNAVKYTTEGRVTVIVEYEYNHRSIPYDDVYLEPVQQWLEPGQSERVYFSAVAEQQGSNENSSDLESDWFSRGDSLRSESDPTSEPLQIQESLSEGVTRGICRQTQTDTAVRLSSEQQPHRGTDYCLHHHEQLGQLMISVTDTGPGIPAEDLASLFQPFVHIRSNDSLKRQAGVGLHLSQHIMKLFDGDIKVKSTVGLGSKFWLEFPIYLVPEQDAIITEDSILQSFTRDSKSSSADRTLTQKIAGKRVLFVEDVSFHQPILNDLGSSLQLTMIQKTSGQDVLAAYMADPAAFDYILSDADMQQFDGIQLVTQIRQFERARHFDEIPTILLSGDSTQARVNKAKRAGVNMYLTKPISRQTLAKALVESQNLSKRVLLIDNSQFRLQLYKHLIQQEDFMVHEQTDAIIALDMLERQQFAPHVIVVKDRMPNIGGEDFIIKQRLQETQLGVQPIPIVVLIDEHTQSSRLTWKHAGATETISLPASSRTFLEALHSVLPHYQ